MCVFFMCVDLKNYMSKWFPSDFFSLGFSPTLLNRNRFWLHLLRLNNVRLLLPPEQLQEMFLRLKLPSAQTAHLTLPPPSNIFLLPARFFSFSHHQQVPSFAPSPIPKKTQPPIVSLLPTNPPLFPLLSGDQPPWPARGCFWTAYEISNDF